MKILLLADGRSAHTMRYQSELIKFGLDVVLASLERGPTVDIRLKKKSISNSLNYFFVNHEIKSLVRKWNPDVVNPHFASGYGFSTAVSRVWKRKPVVLHCLGSDILISPKKSVAHRKKVVYALSKADCIFADSNYLAEEIGKLYSSARITVVPWGVEAEIAVLYSQRAERKWDGRRKLKIFVPRPLSPIYNNRFIIDSLKDLINDGAISLTFPDRGEDRYNFKKLVTANFPEGRIRFYEFQDRKSYIEFLKDFDVYLSASLSDSSPASLIEAMAAGLFPVVADIPGVREWVDDSNSLLFDPRQGESLLEAINRLRQGRMDFDRILQGNHERVMKSALFSRNIEKTIKSMSSFLSNGG